MSKLTQPIFAPSATRLPSQAFRHPQKIFGLDRATIIVLRDQLSLSTWLSLGALLQSLALLTLGRLALLPAILLILTRIGTTYLQTVGILANPYTTGVVPGRVSAQVPSSDGTFKGNGNASDNVVIFLISARSNHPLGALSPHFKQLGHNFDSLRRSVEDRASEYGFLGGSTWMGTDVSAANETMSVMYFSSVAGLHKFAADLAHREAWNWYTKLERRGEVPHMSIWHEMYESRRGAWESVYINSHPTGLGATTFERSSDGQKKFINSLVDAKGHAFGSAKGRMGSEKRGADEEQGTAEIEV